MLKFCHSLIRVSELKTKGSRRTRCVYILVITYTLICTLGVHALIGKASCMRLVFLPQLCK